MIKVSVMYPYVAGARFDHAYYADTHMPLLKARMGDACLFYTVDKGLSGGLPGSDPAFVAMCHIYSDSVDSFTAGFGRMRRKSWATSPTTPTWSRSCRSARS